MKYVEYLHVQSQIERMHEFHPEFFDSLSDGEKRALHEGLLYDVVDSAYPDSIRAYYDNEVAKNRHLQQAILEAAQKIYTLSGSGDIRESMKDIISFSDTEGE